MLGGLENLKIDPAKVIVRFNGVFGGTFKHFWSNEFTQYTNSPISMLFVKSGGMILTKVEI